MVSIQTQFGVQDNKPITTARRGSHLADKLGQGHSGCVKAELQLGGTTHHTFFVGLTEWQGLNQEPVAHRPLHQEACLHTCHPKDIAKNSLNQYKGKKRTESTLVLRAF